MIPLPGLRSGFGSDAACEAQSEARRFLRVSAHELQHLQERRLDGKTFAGYQIPAAAGVSAIGATWIHGGMSVQRWQWHERGNVVSDFAKHNQPV